MLSKGGVGEGGGEWHAEVAKMKVRRSLLSTELSGRKSVCLCRFRCGAANCPSAGYGAQGLVKMSEALNECVSGRCEEKTSQLMAAC